MKRSMPSDNRINEVGRQIMGILLDFYRIIKDAFSWLYASRGLYKMKEYHLVVDALTKGAYKNVVNPDAIKY